MLLLSHQISGTFSLFPFPIREQAIADVEPLRFRHRQREADQPAALLSANHTNVCAPAYSSLVAVLVFHSDTIIQIGNKPGS